MLQYLLDWFWELYATRNVTLAAGPISFTEIYAFYRLNQIDISPSEVSALRRLDIESRRDDEPEPVSLIQSLARFKQERDAEQPRKGRA